MNRTKRENRAEDRVVEVSSTESHESNPEVASADQVPNVRDRIEDRAVSEESEIAEDRVDGAEIPSEERPSMVTLAGLDSLNAGNVMGGTPVPPIAGVPVVSEPTELPEARSSAGGGATGRVMPVGCG